MCRRVVLVLQIEGLVEAIATLGGLFDVGPLHGFGLLQLFLFFL